MSSVRWYAPSAFIEALNTRSMAARCSTGSFDHACTTASPSPSPASAGRAASALGTASSTAGNAPQAASQSRRTAGSSRIATANRVRSNPCSDACSIGSAACDQMVSARPSQVNQRRRAAPRIVGVLRVPMPSPRATRWPSVNPRSGSWQVAQLTVPLAENDASKKSRSPSATALASSAKRLVGSAGMGPRACVCTAKAFGTLESIDVGAGVRPAPRCCCSRCHDQPASPSMITSVTMPSRRCAVTEPPRCIARGATARHRDRRDRRRVPNGRSCAAARP